MTSPAHITRRSVKHSTTLGTHPSPNRPQSTPCFAPLSGDQLVSSKTHLELRSDPAQPVATPPLAATANTPNPQTSHGPSPPSSSPSHLYRPPPSPTSSYDKVANDVVCVAMVDDSQDGGGSSLGTSCSSGRSGSST